MSLADEFLKAAESTMEEEADKTVAELAEVARKNGLALTDHERFLIRQTYIGGFADGGRFALLYLARRRQANS